MPRIAIVGRPNVGKSTLVNTLLGQDRLIVSDIPGTTRDAIDTLVTYKDRHYLFTDTAGIRRRGRIERGIEGYSVARALRAMGRSDIAVLVVDGVEGITEQDTKIAGLAVKQGRACMLAVNKWDLRSNDPTAHETYQHELHRRLPFLTWAPVHFGSALKPESTRQLFPLLDRIMGVFSFRIPTGQLNKFLQELLPTHPLPVRKGRPSKTTLAAYMTQVSTKPPTFALFVGHPENITANYLKLLENRLRKQFDFTGTPIHILVRSK